MPISADLTRSTYNSNNLILGVQQGDPLGPLFFSLVILQFVDVVKFHNLLCICGQSIYFTNCSLFHEEQNLVFILIYQNVNFYPEFPPDIKRVGGL